MLCRLVWSFSFVTFLLGKQKKSKAVGWQYWQWICPGGFSGSQWANGIVAFNGSSHRYATKSSRHSFWWDVYKTKRHAWRFYFEKRFSAVHSRFQSVPACQRIDIFPLTKLSIALNWNVESTGWFQELAICFEPCIWCGGGRKCAWLGRNLNDK